MARTSAALGNGARLTDFLSTSLLARVYPSSLIGDLLDAHKCNSLRKRSFPATAAVYYCMALSLYPEAAYGDVFDAVAQGLAWRCRSAVPTSKVGAGMAIRTHNYLLIPEETKSPAVLRRAWQHASQLARPLLKAA